MALVRRFPRRWWAPAALLVLVYGVVTIWLYPIVIDPVFNRFDKLPPGKLRSEVLELADRAGRERGPGVPGGRQPPHERGERLRDRARAQQARGAVRQPDRRLQPAARCAPSSRTSSATRSTTTCCAGSPGSRSWRPRARSSCRPWRSASARGTARHAGRAARDRARDRAGQPRPGLRLERAVPQGGGERRLVRAPARRATRRTSSASSGASRSRTWAIPTRRGWYQAPVRNASDDDSSGSVPAWRSSPSRLPPLVSRRDVIERVIRELASYERGSASAGERRAAEWLAGELRSAGCRDVRVEEERAHGGYWWPLGLLNAGVRRSPRCSAACPPRWSAARPRRPSTTT